MTPAEQEALEELIDRRGLFATMNAISGICGLKIEHIRDNWQDNDLAVEWERAEAAIDKAAGVILDLNLDIKA